MDSPLIAGASVGEIRTGDRVNVEFVDMSTKEKIYHPGVVLAVLDDRLGRVLNYEIKLDSGDTGFYARLDVSLVGQGTL
jgi:hypothetical protein